MRTSNETTRRLIQMAQDLGGTYEGVNGTGHHLFRFENGATCRISGSPSEYRGTKNAQLEMERASGRRLARATSRRSRKNFTMPSSAPTGVDRLEAAQRDAMRAETDAVARRLLAEWQSIISEPSRRNRAQATQVLEKWNDLSAHRTEHHLPPLVALPVSYEGVSQ